MKNLRFFPLLIALGASLACLAGAPSPGIWPTVALWLASEGPFEAGLGLALMEAGPGPEGACSAPPLRHTPA